MGVAWVWVMSMKIEDIQHEEGWQECVSCSLGQLAVGASVNFMKDAKKTREFLMAAKIPLKKQAVEKTPPLSPITLRLSPDSVAVPLG